MILTILTLFLAQPMPLELEGERIAISAQMSGEPLAVGRLSSFTVHFSLANGASASESGVPSPILQLDVPPSVKLAGKVLETYDELAKNEFLAAPYERLLRGDGASIEFELLAEPEPGASIGVIILAYVSEKEGTNPVFVRRRLELPVVPGVEARPGDDRDSHWGIDENLLQIGDLAASFDLPRADGSRLALEDVLHEQNVLVTTYRAYW